MNAVRKIIEHHSGSITVELPEEYNDKKVEVIVLPLEVEELPKKKYDFSDLVGKLEWKGDAVAEQRRLRDEWD
ncbi:MAG: hypothetical protein C0459_07045 [Chitinophaga sp.]|jgi:hypothetical protein|nr:hypothetical protein [Chitinophaga sp.]